MERQTSEDDDRLLAAKYSNQHSGSPAMPDPIARESSESDERLLVRKHVSQQLSPHLIHPPTSSGSQH